MVELCSHNSGKLGSRANTQFTKHLPQVIVHRVGRKTDPMSDLMVGQPLRDEVRNVQLVGGQRRAIRIRFGEVDSLSGAYRTAKHPKKWWRDCPQHGLPDFLG